MHKELEWNIFLHLINIYYIEFFVNLFFLFHMLAYKYYFKIFSDKIMTK